MAESKALVHSNPTQRLAVYRLQDERGQLRCLREHTFSSNTDCQQEVERFHLMQRLSHPNICQVLRVEETEVAAGWLLTVEMEWCGQDLESLTRSQYPQGWGEDRAAQVFVDVLAALTHAQEQGVCHRDVKPSNLFEASTGYKVADFGSAKSLDNSLSQTMTGTPLFFSPVLRRAFTRALLGEAVSHVDHNPFKSDVYSLGLTVVYLLQPSALKTLGNQTELAKVVSELPIRPSFRDTLHLMLAYEEANRPDFLELAEHMRQLQSPAKEEAQVPAVPSIKRPRARVLKKAQGDPPLPARPESVSSESPPVPIQPRLCQTCGQSFPFHPTEPWRIDLFGSPQSEMCRDYCSSACFQQSFPSPAPRPSGKVPSPSRQEFSVATPLRATTVEQFLHCFQHTKRLPLNNHNLHSAPTILTRCAECDAGQWSEESLPSINKMIVRNSLYPGLVFFLSFDEEEEQYQHFAASAVPVLAAGLCHFCTAQVDPDCWMAFVHNNSLALVCSPECCIGVQQCDRCPTCEAPLMVLSHFPTSGYILYLKDEETTLDCCDLCFCGGKEYGLGCGHGLCRSCATYIPKEGFPAFSCPTCGIILQKSEHPTLFDWR